MSRLGEILGFKVVATLGYGARSTIFAVKDKEHRVYALKHVVKETPTDQRFVDQALREHEVATQLDHPNLRRSYKLIRQRKVLRTSEVFVLMEMVDGHTLEQYVPSDFVELCRLCQQVAEGLMTMHRIGYIHSDIKPNNIMITDSRAVKIIDFGQSCRNGTVKQRIQGTPDYIAPEQVNRRKITPATDIFNLGATMYWLSTGKHVPTLIPKKGRRVKKRGGERRCPLPHELKPEVPMALSALIMACVKMRPEHRPESMANVRDRLGLAIEQATRQNSAPPRVSPDDTAVTTS